MLVYTARVEVPDNATYYEIAEAQLAANWKCESRDGKLDRMERTDINQKCGSCKWFKSCITEKAKSYGECRNPKAQIKVRYQRSRTQKCSQWERRNG